MSDIHYMSVGPRIANFMSLTPVMKDDRFTEAEVFKAVRAYNMFKDQIPGWLDNTPTAAYVIFTKEGFVDTNAEMTRALVKTVFEMCMRQLSEENDYYGMSFEKLWRDAFHYVPGRLDNYWPAGLQHDVKEIYVLVAQTDAYLNVGLWAYGKQYYDGTVHQYASNNYTTDDVIVVPKSKKEITMSTSAPLQVVEPQRPETIGQGIDAGLIDPSLGQLDTTLATTAGEVPVNYGDIAYASLSSSLPPATAAEAGFGPSAIEAIAQATRDVVEELRYGDEPSVIEAPAPITSAVMQLYTDQRTGKAVKFNATYAALNEANEPTSRSVTYLLERAFTSNMIEASMKGMFSKVADWALPRLRSFDLYALPQRFPDVDDILSVYVVSGILDDCAKITFIAVYKSGKFNTYSSTQSLV